MTEPNTRNPDWRNEAVYSNSPCATCTGGGCAVCSIRIGGATGANGLPTGYAPFRTEILLLKPAEHVGMQSEDLSSLESETAGETDAISETLPESGNGTGSASLEFVTLTTNLEDYAPGSTATFAVTGVALGSSVAFRVADLPSEPGINGIADVYAPFSVTDGGSGDVDGLRRALIEGAWTYRMQARVSRKLYDRLEALPQNIRDIAWKAQVRLCSRWRRLAASGKPKVVVTTAIAREMAGFIWAIARQVQPQTAG